MSVHTVKEVALAVGKGDRTWVCEIGRSDECAVPVNWLVEAGIHFYGRFESVLPLTQPQFICTSEMFWLW